MRNSFKFFADRLIKYGELTEEQEETLQQMFFPSLEENKALMESTRDFLSAFSEWEAREKQKSEKQPKPMSDAEIEELANIM